MQAEYDKELQSYFTDVEHLREMFKKWLAAPTLPKRLLVIHGVGGVGKSSLLRMFRLDCKNARVPVALISGDEVKSSVDVLSNWAKDLKADSVTLPTFSKTFDRYRSVLAKIATWGSETKRSGKSAELAGKVLSEAAEEAGGAIIGAAIGSIVPGIGMLAGALAGALVEIGMGMGVGALKDWLRGHGFAQSEIDLVFEPERMLTDYFLTDLTRVASKRRIVTMLDTYEQLTAGENWACKFAQRLHSNVLLVIAGRAVPNWEPIWPGWMANAYVEKLEPMNEDNMRELVHRYYAVMSRTHAEPNPKQVEAIIAFARGLPLVATSAVQLWVSWGTEDFQSVKPKVVADLVERLMKGVPKELVPALEAAAIVRWFDQAILRAILDESSIRLGYEVILAQETRDQQRQQHQAYKRIETYDPDFALGRIYEELRRFPFVRPRSEGLVVKLALHDTVRDIIDENLRVHNPTRHRNLHERAAACFEAQLKSTTGEEAERLGLEWLYHLIESDRETKAIEESLQAISIAYALYRRPYAESILALLNQYLRQEASRRWLALLRYRVALFYPNIELQVAHAKALEKAYQETGRNSRLRALLAIALADSPKETAIPIGKRIELMREAIDTQALTPGELVNSGRRLGDLLWENNQWLEAIQQYNRTFVLYEKSLGDFEKMQLWGSQSYAYLLMGEWDKSIESAQNAVRIARQFGGNILAGQLKGLGWALSYRGDLQSALSVIEEALQLAEQSGDEANHIRIGRRLAEIYDRQERWSLAVPLFLEFIAKDEKYNRLISRASFLALLGISYRKQGILDKAEQLLLESLAHIEIAVEPIALNGLGDLYLVMGNYAKAKLYFERVVSTFRERPYYLAKATLGLAAIDLRLNDFENMEQRLQQVMELSATRSYHDLLSGVDLIKGHAVWDIRNTVQQLSSLYHYQHALIYALRYNRFLLDEVLSGRPQGTPLRPIIPECLKRGKEGRRMLIALRDWWQTGVNDIGAPHPDTISPIPEGIPLLEAERIAREREPGDGSRQRSVVEQITNALEEMTAGH